MIGSTLLEVLSQEGIKVKGTSRRQLDDSKYYLDVAKSDLEANLESVDSGSYLVNCIGLIRHKIENHSHSTARYLNTDFPIRLASLALARNLKLINICTDCIFSGSKGGYLEDSIPDPTDLYGVTKASGEVKNSAVMNLRTSVVGPEVDSSVGLLSWVLNCDKNSQLLGYRNHLWNGITSLALAKIISGIIKNGNFEAGNVHVLPENTITKLELINEIAFLGNRQDLKIISHETSETIDRTLSTIDHVRNRALWLGAGYQKIPTIQQLLAEVLPLNKIDI